ncbi:hypothetical protein PV08_06021 [Exophiala spinifera]|uniref:Arginine N-methyltransferase 2 n=1 Tax=Exophiala spinifera TaxID=91928 RepID=A0A0D1YLS0_9EURO|nr:uncharacterized protein PV08_06021 [Exophiala spinifera]KIW15971.1 hypothetical protein PV08_06021 [Exophiala spinifera]
MGGEVQHDHITRVIRAAAEHDLTTLEECVNEYSFPDCKVVDVQDPETGFSPLHAAILSCRSSVNGHGSAKLDNEDAGSSAIRYLLENGAIWNQLDKNDETPGCLAYRLGLLELYQLMVDAGVRAEMILSRLEEYERMEDDDMDKEDKPEEEQHIAGNDQSSSSKPQDDVIDSVGDHQPDVNTSAYLSSTLSLSSSKLVDDQQNGVMMGWESGIMKQSADHLLTTPGMRVLNIGFGMGIIDSHIQNHPSKPARHYIVEAHPDVLKDMESKGWMSKTGVEVHRGRWQDVLPELVADGETFDAIYFDTFAESYAEFREFFTEHVMALLDQSGRWSFFNGMGADRQISYDIYQKVVEMDLFEAGFEVDWEDVELPKLDQEWDGVRRKYWNIDSYRLPVCKFMD